MFENTTRSLDSAVAFAAPPFKFGAEQGAQSAIAVIGLCAAFTVVCAAAGIAGCCAYLGGRKAVRGARGAYGWAKTHAPSSLPLFGKPRLALVPTVPAQEPMVIELPTSA